MGPTPLFSSLMGIIHTIIGITALVFGVIALTRYGKITPSTNPGRWYVIFTLASCLSSFAVMKAGHLSSAHFLSVLILIVLPVGIFLQSSKAKGTGYEYVGVVAMSMTLFLSFIPTIVETLTRVPVGHPLAANDKDPLVQGLIMSLAFIFVTGSVYQVVRLRKVHKYQLPVN